MSVPLTGSISLDHIVTRQFLECKAKVSPSSEMRLEMPHGARLPACSICLERDVPCYRKWGYAWCKESQKRFVRYDLEVLRCVALSDHFGLLQKFRLFDPANGSSGDSGDTILSWLMSQRLEILTKHAKKREEEENSGSQPRRKKQNMALSNPANLSRAGESSTGGKDVVISNKTQELIPKVEFTPYEALVEPTGKENFGRSDNFLSL